MLKWRKKQHTTELNDYIKDMSSWSTYIAIIVIKLVDLSAQLLS